MSVTYTATGNNIRNLVALYRRMKNIDFRDKHKLKIILDSDCGDGLHRLTLSDGNILECTLQKGVRCSLDGYVQEV